MTGRISGSGDNNFEHRRFPREEQKHLELTNLFDQMQQISSLGELNAYKHSFDIIKPSYYTQDAANQFRDIPPQYEKNLALCKKIDTFIQTKQTELSESKGFFSWAKSLFFSKKSPPPQPFEEKELPSESIDFDEGSEMLDKKDVLSGFTEYEKDQVLLNAWERNESNISYYAKSIEQHPGNSYSFRSDFQDLLRRISHLNFSSHTPSSIIDKLVQNPICLWACTLQQLTNIFASWSSLQDPKARTNVGRVIDFIAILDTTSFAQKLQNSLNIRHFIAELLKKNLISQDEFEKIKTHFSPRFDT